MKVPANGVHTPWLGAIWGPSAEGGGGGGGGGDEGARDRRPYPVAGSDLGAVRREREVGIRAKVGGDFLCLEFVDIQPAGLKGRIVQLEAVFDSFPSPDLSRRWKRRLGCGPSTQTGRAKRQQDPYRYQ